MYNFVKEEFKVKIKLKIGDNYIPGTQKSRNTHFAEF